MRLVLGSNGAGRRRRRVRLPVLLGERVFISPARTSNADVSKCRWLTSDYLLTAHAAHSGPYVPLGFWVAVVGTQYCDSDALWLFMTPSRGWDCSFGAMPSLGSRERCVKCLHIDSHPVEAVSKDSASGLDRVRNPPAAESPQGGQLIAGRQTRRLRLDLYLLANTPPPVAPSSSWLCGGGGCSIGRPIAPPAFTTRPEDRTWRNRPHRERERRRRFHGKLFGKRSRVRVIQALYCAANTNVKAARSVRKSTRAPIKPW